MNPKEKTEHPEARLSCKTPIQNFELAFALMAVLPFLGFVFVITDALTIMGLQGQRGLIVAMLVVISLLGYALGYRLISGLLERLIAANQVLTRLNDLKSVFVSDVSHEVKNPLVTLRLGMAFLSEGLASTLTEDQRQVLSSCQASIDRLIRITNDLLDLAKIESGHMAMSVTKVDLKSLSEEIIAFMRKAVEAKKLKFRSDFTGGNFTLQGDRDHLARLVINLMDNAVKYTQEGGEIGLSLTEGKEHLALDIWNEGAEIPAARRDKIFERFERVSFDKATGSGLGLPIAKELSRLHGGEIRLEHRASANHFLVELPKVFRNP